MDNPQRSVKALIKTHLELRPLAQPQDIYKLLFQGVFGVSHIISDKTWERLLDEAKRISLDDDVVDPLVEPVCPYASMIRVNLRPYLKAGGDLEDLYQAMMETASYVGSSSVFRRYWAQFKELTLEELNFNWMDIEAIDETIRRVGVNPLHHTQIYRDAYHPAYRVVSKTAYVKHCRP